MTKELQNLAWSLLPKEFKEEVKKYYHTLHKQYIDYAGLHFDNAKAKVKERIVTLEYLFGIHNLASDAEEEEMLTAPRSKVQKIFAGQTEVQKNTPCETILHYEAAAKTELLYTLFGSKCLPDNSNEDNYMKSEPKESKVGKEMLTCNKESVCKFYAHLLDMVENERMSEHYPEWCDLESEYIALFGEKAFADYFRPKCPSDGIADKVMKPAEENFNNTLKDSFHNERRLNIAVKIAQGMYANPTIAKVFSYTEIAQRAVEVANIFISECEKGDAE